MRSSKTTSGEPSAGVEDPRGEPLEDAVVRVIVPAKRRLRPADLIREAPVIRVLATRDFKAKYKQSALGPIWLVFQPLALLLVFLVAFRGRTGINTAHMTAPYAVFTLVGLTSWAFFQAAMTIGTSSFITNITFVRYTPCPRLGFPAAAIIASLPSFFVTAAGAIFAAVATGFLSPRVVLLPVALVWLLCVTAGIVAISSSLAVTYRDVISAVPFALQLGLFLAPIGYPLSSLSPTLRTIVELNPLTGVMEASRWMVITGYHPSIASIVASLCVGSVMLVVGWRIFTRAETTMADVI